jgi:DME family drug/metabolite transporter
MRDTDTPVHAEGHVALEPSRSELAGVVAILLADVCWGLGNVFVKLADMPGISFALYRLWLGFVCFAVICIATRRPIDRGTIRIAIPAGLTMGLYMVLIYSALKATNVADVAIIAALQPALVLLVAGPLFGERITLREVGLVCVAMLGVVVVILGSAGSPSWTLGGDLLAVLALIAFTGFWLASKHARSRANLDALGLVTASSLIGAVVVTPPALIADHGLPVPTGSAWVWLALTVLIPGVLGHGLAAWAQRYVEVWRSSLCQLGMPVASVIAAWAILGEGLTPLAIVGAVIVVGALSAVRVATRSTSLEAELPTDEPVV